MSDTQPSPQSPSNLIRRGFDWSGTTPRLPYILVSIAAIGLASLIPATRNFSGANTAVFVSLTMIFPMWLGHTRRRLRDVGWSGWYMWVAIMPVIGLILTIFLAFKPGDTLDAQGDEGYSRVGFAVSLAFGALLLSRTFWAPYWIPAGAMKPTLVVGDFVAVVPVNEPRRGDVLVFRTRAGDAEYIKRVIGLPGDTVSVSDGVVILNGTPLSQENLGEYTEPFTSQGPMQFRPRCANDPADGEACIKTVLRETLPEGAGYNILDISPHLTDNADPITVEEGQYYVLGDNRDNSADSRLALTSGGLGLTERELITGRVTRVLFSSAGTSFAQVWTWRGERFWKKIE